MVISSPADGKAQSQVKAVIDMTEIRLLLCRRGGFQSVERRGKEWRRRAGRRRFWALG